jgi:hypothetical protein
MIKYYVDEPDVASYAASELPLFGVREDTVFYDSLEEAEKVAELWMNRSGDEIAFCVWTHETT